MNALEALEYREDHPRMIWSIHKSGEIDELCFKAPDGVKDGIYTVEVIGLRKPYGRYERPW